MVLRYTKICISWHESSIYSCVDQEGGQGVWTPHPGKSQVAIGFLGNTSSPHPSFSQVMSVQPYFIYIFSSYNRGANYQIYRMMISQLMSVCIHILMGTILYMLKGSNDVSASHGSLHGRTLFNKHNLNTVPDCQHQYDEGCRKAHKFKL